MDAMSKLTQIALQYGQPPGNGGLRNIRCAVCCKRVDTVSTWTDPQTRATVIEVACHGQTQQMQLTTTQIDQGLADAIDQAEGVAFETPEPGESALKIEFQSGAA